MSVEEVYAPTWSQGAFGGFSAALIDLIEGVQPSVVQVRNQGRGIGAGVIWDADGSIITNHHVIDGERGNGVSVLLTDGREFEARIIGSEPSLDLALLKIPASELPKAKIADSTTVRVGEMVFAIGHPWGRRGVATAGIVSGLGEVSAPGGRRSAQYIRSDVRLAPGNSGGPMLNAQGQVVGINAMIFGGDLAVAIPAHVATRWVASLNNSGGSSALSLGVGVQPVEVRTERPGDRPNKVAGLLVVIVQPDSVAAKNGIVVGDILLEAGGQTLTETEHLKASLSGHNPASALPVRLMRAGAIKTLEARF
jgi:serine protease Do